MGVFGECLVLAHEGRDVLRQLGSPARSISQLPRRLLEAKSVKNSLQDDRPLLGRREECRDPFFESESPKRGVIDGAEQQNGKLGGRSAESNDDL
jgi:hypothetical protein